MKRGMNRSDCSDDVPIGGYFNYAKWYCPNCANLNSAIRNDNGIYISVCPKCGVYMRRKHKSRNVDIIEVVISDH